MEPAGKPRIRFFFNSKVSLANRTGLKRFIESMFLKENRSLSSLNVLFVNDKELKGLNRKFLNHNYYTDILSFDLSGGSEPLEGEIYISAERVRENASLLGQRFGTELHRVIFHGILHFCGYGDKTRSDKATMREREDYYLKEYFSRM